MYPLKQRSASDGVIFHAHSPTRVYADDAIQGARVARAQIYLDRCIADSGKERCSIVELGCGTADISGPFSGRHDVVGIDCNEQSLATAKKRFPEIITLCRSIDEAQPIACDVLVLCETLEHLADPPAVVKAWLPLAEMVVISHPLDEPVESGLSAGEHQWGLSEMDFASWFNIGGARISEEFIFQMGAYQIIMGRGRRHHVES